MSLVLDSSVTLSWFFEDERTAVTASILKRVVENGAVVPVIWRLEVANALQSNLYGDLRGDCVSAPGSCRAHRTRRSHGNDLAPPVLWAEARSRSDGDRRVVLAAAELGAIGPHPMQDGCELAGDRDAGPCHRPAADPPAGAQRS